MSKPRLRPTNGHRVYRFESTNPLLVAWIDAARDWRRLRSDPAERRVRLARAAYYQSVLGYVPPLFFLGGATEE